MGCSSSTDASGNALTKQKSGETKSERLLDSYVLGDVLGQGAFGIVYACALKDTKDFIYAVKMVDKYETPVADIKREAEMLKRLEHPNVVKCHNVYFEKIFVCIVMDKYNGGDLIEGMQLHWNTKGKIPCQNVIHIVRQMCMAIRHLHDNLTIHRDVKGDNFLTDRKDIRDPDCRLMVSDFGTASKMNTPQDRMRAVCGTKLYWAPEFYKLNYGLKVDVWALGVVMYGLLEGRFPFKTEGDVMTKQLKITTAKAPEQCLDLLNKLLMKDEDTRVSAAEAAAHPWCSADGGDANEDHKAENNEEFQPEGVLKEGACAAADERRKELVERLEDAERKKKGDKEVLAIWSPKFAVSDARKGKTTRYEWWPKKKAEELIGQGDTVSDLEGDKADVGLVDKMLRDHDIDSSKFGVGTAKTLDEFAHEVHTGSALLMLDASTHKKLVRVVDVVLLRVLSGGKYLVEASEVLRDGRSRDDLNRLPGTKKDPHENLRSVSNRIATDMLNLGADELMFNFQNPEHFEEQEESISYPGVTTVYRKTIVGCKTRSDLSARGPYAHEDSNHLTKHFKWMTEKECKSKQIMIRAPVVGDDVSALIQAPVGMKLEDLRQYLIDNKIDPEEFGKGGTCTLDALSKELLKGESSLMVQSDGCVVRVVDVVVLFITKEGEDEALVETQEKFNDGTVNKFERLPGIKRRPDENIFSAGQKLLSRQLHANENLVTIDAANTKTIEEVKDSPHYPLLKTVYRRRIINAELHKAQE
eukprot:TRINITY_DN22695_c0_g1_i1.p1 TRINITY_DN22695_c0_g1~~TRINITY_DN22695_c0_g1_i1.p1  ORF type:complete len:755 (-),score=174.66 TRINITY_DN22695_c0_g1_i1:255-2519(-)